MKNVLRSFGIISVLALPCLSITSGRPVAMDDGDNATFTKSVVPVPGTAAGGVVISTFSSTRNYLQCRNTGATQIYIGDYAGIGNASTGTFQVDPATAGVTSLYFTRTKEQLWAIGNPGGSTIYCEEGR